MLYGEGEGECLPWNFPELAVVVNDNDTVQRWPCRTGNHTFLGPETDNSFAQGVGEGCYPQNPSLIQYCTQSASLQNWTTFYFAIKSFTFLVKLNGMIGYTTIQGSHFTFNKCTVHNTFLPNLCLRATSTCAYSISLILHTVILPHSRFNHFFERGFITSRPTFLL